MTTRWPHTWFLLALWATDQTLAFRDYLARAGHAERVTAEEWSAGINAPAPNSESTDPASLVVVGA